MNYLQVTTNKNKTRETEIYGMPDAKIETYEQRRKLFINSSYNGNLPDSVSGSRI